MEKLLKPLLKDNSAPKLPELFCVAMGEAPALSKEEKLALIRKAKSLVKNEIRIMAGTGGNNTRESKELHKPGYR